LHIYIGYLVSEVKIAVVMASLCSRRGHLIVGMVEKENYWCQRPSFVYLHWIIGVRGQVLNIYIGYLVSEVKIAVVMASLYIRRGHLSVAMVEKKNFWCQRLKFLLTWRAYDGMEERTAYR